MVPLRRSHERSYTYRKPIHRDIRTHESVFTHCSTQGTHSWIQWRKAHTCGLRACTPPQRVTRSRTAWTLRLGTARNIWVAWQTRKCKRRVYIAVYFSPPLLLSATAARRALRATTKEPRRRRRGRRRRLGWRRRRRRRRRSWIKARPKSKRKEEVETKKEHRWIEANRE